MIERIPATGPLNVIGSSSAPVAFWKTSASSTGAPIVALSVAVASPIATEKTQPLSSGRLAQTAVFASALSACRSASGTTRTSYAPSAGKSVPPFVA